MRASLLTLRGRSHSVRSTSAMRTPGWLIFCFFAGIGIADAAAQTPENQPVEITASGETTYQNGVATARDNVAIHIGDTDIYADFAQYNSHTHEVSAEGHVRIYRDVSLYLAEHGVYNLDTKEVRTSSMRTEYNPYFLSGENVTQTSQNAYRVENATFTTADAPNPDFHLHARTARVYENDHVVFREVTFYIENVQVFWWPYLYQSLNDAFNFTVSPAYLNSWGPWLLTQITFPITDNIKGRLRLDYRGRQRLAIGFESDIDYGKDNSSYAKLKTYYLQDQNAEINRTALRRGDVSAGRYRVSLEDRTNFTDDIYAIVDITKLSDPFVMQDFYQNEFRINPVPDNVIALTKSAPFYTLTAITRFQANEFFEQTERLPEVVLDVKRHALFGGPIFYEVETGLADLHRNFSSGSDFEDYSPIRSATFTN